MSDVLDLDALAPENKTVKVNGQVYEILPLKLSNFLAIQKTLKNIKGATEEQAIDLMGEVFDSMRPIVPDLDKMDLTMKQAFALLEFIYKQEEANNKQTTEKKMDNSPTP